MITASIPLHDLEENIVVRKIEESIPLNFDGTHRHNFYELLFFTEVPAGGLHSIDFEQIALRTDCIYILKPGQAYSMVLSSHKGFLVAIKPDYLRSSGLLFENRLEYSAPGILDMGNRDMDALRSIIGFLHEEYTGSGRRELITAHVHTLLSYLNIFIREYQQASGINSRMRTLLELIERNYIREHDTAFYAAGLSLGKKRLNVLSVEAFDQTVKELLRQRLLLQAKRMISTGHSTFKEISSELGFKDASYFSRFFRHNAGMTPEEFRHKLTKRT